MVGGIETKKEEKRQEFVTINGKQDYSKYCVNIFLGSGFSRVSKSRFCFQI